MLDFGHLSWQDNQTVADYIYIELNDLEITFKRELENILVLYRQWLEAGIQPGIRNFLYHEDPAISTTAVSLQDFKHEVSLRWKEEPHELKLPTREELYKEEIESVLLYLKLRRVRWLIENNQRDLEKPNSEQELIILLQTHKELKQWEMEMTKALGTVIFK